MANVPVGANGAGIRAVAAGGSMAGGWYNACCAGMAARCGSGAFSLRNHANKKNTSTLEAHSYVSK